jgi:short-subunit dehydrogenase
LAGPLLAHPVQERHYEAELNCVSVLRSSHAAAAAMVARGRGTILNVASELGFFPFPGAAVYSAGKAFVLNFSATLRYELRGTGVGVTSTVTPAQPAPKAPVGPG